MRQTDNDKSASIFRRRSRLIKWLVPTGIVRLVIAYEQWPHRWTLEALGFPYHVLAEILLFGTVGPVMALVLLELLGRWIDEKETADLQTQLITQANEKELEGRRLSDDTLQVLFATSLLITTFRSGQSDLPADVVSQIEVTEQTVNDTIQRLRFHLLS